MSYMCDTCEVNHTCVGFVDSTYVYTSAQQYIGKYNYRDRFTKPVQLVKQYLKTGLSMYRLCLYNHGVQCIIAVVFYEVGNKKTTYLCGPILAQKNREGHLKVEDITMLQLCT